MLGTASGDLLIVSMLEMDRIIFRLKPFGSPIRYIYELEAYFVSDPTKAVLLFGTEEQGLITEVCASKLPV